MKNWKPSLGDRMMRRLFEYQVITETDCDAEIKGTPHTGDVYLVRYFIWNHNKTGQKKPHIYLHHILKSDPDREFHDHPWGFYSLILKGGYTEETPVYTDDPKLANIYKHHNVKQRTWYGAGSFLRRPAEWAHRLFLEPGKTAWTLVYTQKKRREWGFHALLGWVHNRDFIRFKCTEDGSDPNIYSKQT